MKQWMKVLTCAMALLMMVSGAAAAVRPVDFDALERYPAYTLDKETGAWSVNSYQADALTDQIWYYGRRYSTPAGVFYLAAEGDARTGVWTPVLRMVVTDSDPINARSVSLMLGNQRMDLAASSQMMHKGRYSAEMVTAPLTPEGWAFVSAMAGAEASCVRVIGQETVTLELDVNGTGERRQMEASSLAMLANGAALMKELGIEGYELWDLSADAWETKYGYRPASTLSEAEATVDDVMGMVCPEDTGDAAENAQISLTKYGYLSVLTTRKHDENAVAATLRAQRYLGRVQTGCFDAALEKAMEAGAAPAEETQAQLQPVGGAALADVNRWWFAKGVSASRNPETLRAVVNQDNLFLIADGVIASLSEKDIHLFVDMEAKVVYNGRYSYQAELVTEGSDGTALDTLILPLSQSRLIAYAEVPARLAGDEDAQWQLVITHSGESLTIDLE